MFKYFLFNRSLILLSTVSVAALYTSDAAAAMPANEPPKWYPEAHVDLKQGTKRGIAQVGTITPLAQNATSLAYLDLRLMSDTNKAKEGNFGAGGRWLKDGRYILGMYALYDRRYTELNNIVNQVTVGSEIMSDTWDYRVNVYVPENLSKTIVKETKPEQKTTFAGYTEVQKSTQYLVKEVPLRGLDLEIGRTVPGFPALRVYGAYYHFQGRDGVESVIGGRIRANLKLNKFFSFETEVSRDNVRKEVAFIGMRLTIPLSKTGYKPSTLTSLEQRMVEPPTRDIDAVTNTQNNTTRHGC